MNRCRCGGPLMLGTEALAGRCNLCADGVHLETVEETVAHLVRGGNLTKQKVTSQPKKVTSQGNLTEEEVTSQETKQQRWKRKNSEKVRAVHRDGQARRRNATA